MNIKLILSITLFFMLNNIYGQDKIITIQNDTIECKILSISATHINYEQTGNDYQTGKFIPVSQVLEYYRNTAQKTSDTPKKTRRSDSPPFKRWQIGIQYGGSYLVGSTAVAENELTMSGISENEAKDFFQKLKLGIHVGGNVHYLFNKYVGAGLKYSLFYSSAISDFVASGGYYEGPNMFIGVRDDQRIYLNYVGHSVISQQCFGRGKKFKLTEEISLGYANLREELRLYNSLYSLRSNALATGHTVGGTAGVSFEYCLPIGISIGAHTNVFVASFTKLTVSGGGQTETVDLNPDEYENMNRIDYGVSVRFHF
jgi:hypothetical protein